MANLKQIPLTCSGHTRPVVHLDFSDIIECGYFLISACKGTFSIYLFHFIFDSWYLLFTFYWNYIQIVCKVIIKNMFLYSRVGLPWPKWNTFYWNDYFVIHILVLGVVDSGLFESKLRCWGCKRSILYHSIWPTQEVIASLIHFIFLLIRMNYININH